MEPSERDVRIRLRLDGVLREAERLPVSIALGIVARIKVLASLDIAEKRRPQDGRIAFRHGARTVDLRVSVLPSTTGEKVVLRVLDRDAVRLDYEALGLRGKDHHRLTDALARPHGLVLVTGPTGSGKTTTLYAALSSLDSERLNLLSVEDPVEYELDGVTQVAVRDDLGFGFAEALRSFLRQDPDVIMVGEIRDAETAQIAVRAALTGHLVLSTLHTNDAPSAPARLLDMGVESYLLAASLRLVIAQRLVRLLCEECSEPLDPSSSEAEMARALAGGDGDFRQTLGCNACGGTGFRGRTAVFETVEVDEAFSTLVSNGASAAELRACAYEAGTTRLSAGAARLVLDGRTSVAEALRAVGA